MYWYLLRAVLPLLIGTVLEYGEWEVLTIALRFLGPAEGACVYFLQHLVLRLHHYSTKVFHLVS